MKAERLRKYEKAFLRGRLILLAGVGFELAFAILAIIWWQDIKPNPFWIPNVFIKAHPLVGLSMLVLQNLGLITFSTSIALWDIYKSFLEDSRIFTASLALSNASGKNMIRPKFRLFLFARNLFEFEETHAQRFEELRKEAVRRKHQSQSVQDAETAAQRIDGLQKRFETGLSNIAGKDKEIARYRRRFRDVKSAAEAQAIVDELEAKPTNDEASVANQTAKRARLIFMLGELTVGGISEEAEKLLRESESTTHLKRAIGLLTQAITIQKAANKERDHGDESETETSRDGGDASLTPRPSLLELFPQEVNRDMASQILEALAERNPTSRIDLQSQSASNYRAAFKKPFPVYSFNEALGWLVAERIVIENANAGKRTYTLNTKPSTCPSEHGPLILRAFLDSLRTS